jgi:hypothetical protein
MQKQHKKLQMHEKELFLPSGVMAEYNPKCKTILNTEIRKYVVVHMQTAELAYKPRVQSNTFLCPTSFFLLEQCISRSN